MKRIWFALVREIFRRSILCWFNYGNLVTTFISSRQPKWLFSGRVIGFVIGNPLGSTGLTRYLTGRSGWRALRRLARDNIERSRTETKIVFSDVSDIRDRNKRFSFRCTSPYVIKCLPSERWLAPLFSSVATVVTSSPGPIFFPFLGRRECLRTSLATVDHWSQKKTGSSYLLF